MTGRFDEFAALHRPGNPVILYNVWDPGSALAVAGAGAVRQLRISSRPEVPETFAQSTPSDVMRSPATRGRSRESSSRV